MNFHQQIHRSGGRLLAMALARLLTLPVTHACTVLAQPTRNSFAATVAMEWPE
eukprot:COSAG02_NODE_62873_length_264_cov_1.551515_1_plen_52_part_01